MDGTARLKSSTELEIIGSMGYLANGSERILRRFYGRFSEIWGVDGWTAAFSDSRGRSQFADALGTTKAQRTQDAQ